MNKGMRLGVIQTLVISCRDVENTPQDKWVFRALYRCVYCGEYKVL